MKTHLIQMLLHKTLDAMLVLTFATLLITCKRDQAEYVIVKTTTAKHGMVVTAHPLASEIGLDILKQGGNAADAAIAVQFALAVVYPRAGNIGGGGFLVYRDERGEVNSLDFREKAPLAAYRDMYLDSTGHVIKGLSTEGMMASGVPGTVAGLAALYEKYGSGMSWSKLVEPAVILAERGFRITKSEADRLNSYRDVFSRLNPPDMPFLSSASWKVGDILIQKELAATLRRIAKNGKDGFYAGSNAAALLALSANQHGMLSASDLDSYNAVWRKPLTNLWRGYEIHSMNLPSSGGIVLGQILGMIENHLVDTLGYRDPQNIHLIVEAERRAYIDRAHYLGDADFYPVPVDSLLDRAYLLDKFSDFDSTHATQSQSISPEKFTLVKEHFETTHFSIVDKQGNAASVTTTLNDNFGCKVWVPGGGYFLNNEMDDFSASPGEPNLYGLIGAEANSIAPGKRMLSSMTPTIIEKEGNLWMVLGTPGGSTIITSVLQVFLNVASFGMDIGQAVEAGRYHHQWLPDEIMVEDGAFSPMLEQQLKAMDYKLVPVSYIGMIEAILIDKEGLRHGAADPRGDDHAAGW